MMKRELKPFYTMCKSFPDGHACFNGVKARANFSRKMKK